MPDNFSLTFGKDRMSFSIPEPSLAGPLIKPREGTPLPGNTAEIIRKALERPAGRPPVAGLVKDKIVGLVSSDEFRSGLQKDIIFALVSEVAQGRPKKLKILIATGTHDISIYARNITKWAEEAVKGLPFETEVIANDCYGKDFVLIGKTPKGTPLNINRGLLSCDVRIYGHEAKYHYMNGYSCVDKQVLPGLSSMETVRANHKNSLDHNNSAAGRNPWHKDPERQFNPFGIDIRDARAASEKFFLDENGNPEERKIQTFGLDMVSESGGIYWIKAGDPDAITREMTAAVDRLSLFKAKKSKYVVISPGGKPACDTIYSTQNCFDMALKGAIQDGGEALVIAPCAGREDVPESVRGLAPDANSKKLFWDNLAGLRDETLKKCSEFIDKNFELYLWKTDRVLKLMKENKVRIYLYSRLDPERVKQGGFIPAVSVQAWIDERVERADGGTFRVIDNGNKVLVQSE